jgi:hypothetical protein
MCLYPTWIQKLLADRRVCKRWYTMIMDNRIWELIIRYINPNNELMESILYAQVPQNDFHMHHFLSVEENFGFDYWMCTNADCNKFRKAEDLNNGGLYLGCKYYKEMLISRGTALSEICYYWEDHCCHKWDNDHRCIFEKKTQWEARFGWDNLILSISCKSNNHMLWVPLGKILYQIKQTMIEQNRLIYFDRNKLYLK